MLNHNENQSRLNSSELSEVNILRSRVAIGSFFFMQGLCFSSWGARIPSIQAQLNLSEVELGAVLLSLPVGQLVSLPFAGWFVSKLGSHLVLIYALCFYMATLILIGISHTSLQIIIVLCFFGIAGNLVNISTNSQAVAVEKIYKRSIMASFHGLWSLAGFSGASLGVLMMGLEVSPLIHFLCVSFFVGLGLLFNFSHLIISPLVKGQNPTKFKWPTQSLVILGAIAFCSMVCEGAMFDWSGVYFKKVILAENAWTGAGYAAFMFTMASGRFVVDRFVSQLGIRKIIQISGLLTASGLLIAVLFPTLTFGVIGFLLVGAGVSAVVPLVYSAAGRSREFSPSMALSIVSTIGYFGFLIGPPLIGFVAGAADLRVSFSIIALMGLVMSAASLGINKYRTHF